MGVPENPHQDITALSQAHLKGVEPQRATSESGWDIPLETQKRRKLNLGGASAARWALSDRIDRILSPHKRYFGQSRRTLLTGVLVAFVCLLALIIGLAVGLGKGGSKKIQNLPLPKGAEVYTGELTYYGTGMGACGITSTDNDPIVAISHYTFDAVQKGSDPNSNPLCGRKIRTKRVDERTGQSVSVDLTVVDRCVGCQPTDLDVSPAMFAKLANPDLGRVKTTWAWL